MKRWCFSNLLVILCCFPLGLLAQVENTHWIFSALRMLNANSGFSISSIANPLPGTINAALYDKSVSLTNCDSELIFYAHQRLFDGNDSMLFSVLRNPAFTIDYRNDTNIVYLFGNASVSGSESFIQLTLRYNLDWQLLSITLDRLHDRPFINYAITEKHDQSGLWIIVSNLNVNDLKVYSWSNGVISSSFHDSIELRNTHPFFGQIPSLGFRSGITISLDGSRIALTRSDNRTLSFLHFDTHSGRLSDEMQLNVSNLGLVFVRPLLFSQDGLKFYFESNNLFQIDLSVYDSIFALGNTQEVLSYPANSIQHRNISVVYNRIFEIQLIRLGRPNNPIPNNYNFILDVIRNPNQHASNLTIDTLVANFVNEPLVMVPGANIPPNRPYQLPQLFLPNRFNIRAPAEACPNDSVAPALGDYLNVRNVRWNFGDGSAEQTKRFPKHAYSQPGTYTITAYFQHCSNIDTVYHQITILDTPASVALPDTVFCAGGTLPLQVQLVSGQQYLWSTGDSLPNTNISSGGWHWVEQRNACFSRRDSFYVEAQLPPQSGLPLDTNLCEGDVLVLSPQASAYSWRWQDGSTQPLQVSQSGTYALLMTNACGTFVHQSRVVYHQAPAFELKDTSRCEGQFLRVELPEFWQANYQWSDGVSERIRVLTDSGWYQVRISNPCGESSSAMFLQLSDCMCHMYLPTAFSPNGDGLNDQLTVATRCELSSFQMEVYDRWGRLLFSSNQLDHGWDGHFNGQLLPPGAYPFVIRYTPEGRNPRLEKGVVNLIR